MGRTGIRALTGKERHAYQDFNGLLFCSVGKNVVELDDKSPKIQKHEGSVQAGGPAQRLRPEAVRRADVPGVTSPLRLAHRALLGAGLGVHATAGTVHKQKSRSRECAGPRRRFSSLHLFRFTKTTFK